MNRKMWLATLLAFVAATLGGLPARLSAEEPQIAFRLLDDYVVAKQEKSDSGRQAGAIVSLVAGALLAGGGLGLYFAGDSISEKMGAGPIEPSLKLGISVGLGATGAALFGVGLHEATTKPRDLRKDYQAVYGESDPLVQEAMAAATLKSLADKGRNQRVVNGFMNLGIAALDIAIAIGANVSQGEPWADNLGTSFGISSWSIFSALRSIFTSSDEELLYGNYLAARQAYYSVVPREGQEEPRTEKLPSAAPEGK